MAKKGKSTPIPYGKHNIKKRKTRAGGSCLRVGGRNRIRKPRLTAGTFPVIVTYVNNLEED